MKKILSVIVFTAIAFAVVPQVQAQGINLYYETFNERTNKQESKTWMDDKGNMRTESLDSPGTFTIMKLDSTTGVITMYRCDGKTKTFTKMPVPTEAGANQVETFLGKEEVEGRMCDHYRITWTGRPEVEEQWRDPSFYNTPIRQRSGKLDPIIIRNIKQDPQPANLFEIPADFKEQALPDLNKFQNMQDALKKQNPFGK